MSTSKFNLVNVDAFELHPVSQQPIELFHFIATTSIATKFPFSRSGPADQWELHRAASQRSDLAEHIDTYFNMVTSMQLETGINGLHFYFVNFEQLEKIQSWRLKILH